MFFGMADLEALLTVRNALQSGGTAPSPADSALMIYAYMQANLLSDISGHQRGSLSDKHELSTHIPLHRS